MFTSFMLMQISRDYLIGEKWLLFYCMVFVVIPQHCKIKICIYLKIMKVSVCDFACDLCFTYVYLRDLNLTLAPASLQSTNNRFNLTQMSETTKRAVTPRYNKKKSILIFKIIWCLQSPRKWLEVSQIAVQRLESVETYNNNTWFWWD